MTELKNALEILKLPHWTLETITEETRQSIKAQYFQLAKQNHPDKISKRDEKEAHERFIEISNAYNVVMIELNRKSKEKKLKKKRGDWSSDVFDFERVQDNSRPASFSHPTTHTNFETRHETSNSFTQEMEDVNLDSPTSTFSNQPTTTTNTSTTKQTSFFTQATVMVSSRIISNTRSFISTISEFIRDDLEQNDNQIPDFSDGWFSQRSRQPLPSSQEYEMK